MVGVEMKKRNKALLGMGIVLAVVFGIASVSIGFFVAGLSPILKLVLFDLAILSAGVGVFDAVALSASLATGYVKRRNAEKTQANSLAKIALEQVQKKGNYNENIATNVNEKKLVKDLAKSIAYTADNKKAGVLGNKFGFGKTKNQLILENQKEAYETYNLYENIYGSNKGSKIASKKLIKTETKMQKEQAKASSMSGSFEFVASVHVPQLNKNVIDNRTGANLNNEEYLNEFKTYACSENSLKTRYGSTYKKNYGYVASIENNQMSNIKNTYVKSNAESEMPNYELILLKDLQQEINEREDLQNVFPLMLKKRHYITDKKFQDRSVVIKNKEQLNDRINYLSKMKDGDKRVKIQGNGYVNQNYYYSDFATDEKELTE